MYLNIGAIIRGPTPEVKRIGKIRSLLAGKKVWIGGTAGASSKENVVGDMN